MFADTETDMLRGEPLSASCVQGSDDSRNSAIRIAYRTLLRSSSLWEPRYPSLRIWFWLLSLVRLLCMISLLVAAAAALPAYASCTAAATEG